MRAIHIIYILIAIILASCNGDFEAEQLPAPVPLSISASVVNGVETRAEKSAFANGDVITLSDGSTTATYSYSNGSWSSSSPYYFRNTQSVTFTAYANESGDDKLFATATGSYNGGVSFEFKHKMSRLTFTFTEGNDVRADELDAISDICLTGIYSDGIFPAANGDAIHGSTIGSVAVSNKCAIIYPQTLPTTAKLSFTMNSVPYIVSMAGLTYSAGYTYKYTVKVSRTAATVWGESSINGWPANSSSTDVAGSVYTYGSITSADEVKLYALAFVDGSFENISVDNAADLSALTDIQLANVAGIVFKIDSALGDDSELAADYPECDHGLILSLYNVTSDRYAKPTDNGGTNAEVMSWQQKADTVGVGVANQEIYTDKLIGYSQTKIISKYNNSLKNESYIVCPIYALENEFAYRDLYPSGASKWYMPSLGELKLLYSNKSSIEAVLDALEKRNIAARKFAENGSSYCWSSSEYSTDVGYSIRFSGDTEGKVTHNSKTINYYHVRAICAF